MWLGYVMKFDVIYRGSLVIIDFLKLGEMYWVVEVRDENGF